jgi:hypothetical protein
MGLEPLVRLQSHGSPVMIFRTACHNHRKTTAYISKFHLYFVMSYGCHRRKQDTFFYGVYGEWTKTNYNREPINKACVTLTENER